MSAISMTLPGILLGQVASDAENAMAVQSVWDFLVKGGPMMVPILVCSLVAMTVVAERLITLSRRKVIPPEFLSGVKDTIKPDAKSRDKALAYCVKNGSHVANIFAVAIKRFGEPVELLEKHIQEAGEREVLKLRKFLRLLMVIGAIAPLMGLLGTIFGMIQAFQTVATSGEALGKTELLAGGIYEAMITTAAGLLLAIPVVIAYHWISAKVEGLVAEMDRVTVDFIEEYAGHDFVAAGVAGRLKGSDGNGQTAESATTPDAQESVAC